MWGRPSACPFTASAKQLEAPHPEHYPQQSNCWPNRECPPETNPHPPISRTNRYPLEDPSPSPIATQNPSGKAPLPSKTQQPSHLEPSAPAPPSLQKESAVPQY